MGQDIETASTRQARPKSRYPRKAEIVRAVQAAKECGLDVAGIEISPDGVIRIFESRAAPTPETEFDRWEHLL